MKWWTMATVSVAVAAIVLAGRKDIERFRQMKQM